MASLIKATLATMGWEIMNRPSYGPDLAPNDIHLFGPMKVHPGGQRFRTVDEHKHSVLNWLHNQDKTFYVAGFIILPGRWKKCT
jgi:hypothetical protein